MKRYLSLSIAAVAAILAFAPTAQADDRYVVREYRNADGDLVVQRTVVDRDDPWLVRAGRSVVRTPLIIGETIAGRRQVVSDDGMFVRNGRVYYRDDSRFDDDMDRTGYAIKRGAKRTGRAIGDAAESTGRFFARTGRTIVHAPEAIAESLDHDHDRYDHDRFDEDEPDMFKADGRTLLGRGPGDDLELFGD